MSQARATSDFVNMANGEFLCKALYVPQKKAEIIYNLFSGRKINVFQEKSFCFENFNFCIQGVTKKMAPLTNFRVLDHFYSIF